MRFKTIREILITTGIFCLGLIVSALIESRLRQIIQYLFKSLTQNGIRFYGKDFHLFVGVHYYLSFAITFLILRILFNGLTSKQRLTGGILTIFAFLMAIVIICWFEANRMILECTACHHGTRGIHHNDIDYDGIVVGGLLFALIPGVILMLRKRRSANADVPS